MTEYRVTLTPYRGPETLSIPPKKHGKLIVQVARTNCAGAIWRIHEALNRYTEHTCRTITASDTTNGRRYQRDVLLNQPHEVSHLLAKADVVHFHNWIDHESAEMAPYRHLLGGKRMVLQYHTEPALLQKAFRRNVVERDDITTLVIAQKHTRFYPKSIPVPNMVDIWSNSLMPVQRRPGKLRVIYTPSDTKAYSIYTTTCCGKGYPHVLPVLKKLQAEGLIEATILQDKTWEELMPIKQQHDVCIDECVTGGYHLCSLEALAQGLATIGWIDTQTSATIANIVGNDTELPWINTQQHDLEARLRHLAANLDVVQEWQQRARRWMEENWSPHLLVNHFLNAYWPGAAATPSKPQKVTTYEHKNTPSAPGSIDQRWGNSNGLNAAYLVPSSIRPSAKALANAWAGQRVVVWGNGPTAAEAVAMRDQPWFSQAKHIGTNAAVKLGISFDAYCIGDRRFLDVAEKRAIATSAPGVRVYLSVLRPFLPADIDASFVECIGRDGFCSDIVKGCYHGYSVAWVALQLALFTGARDILLAGCGHDYQGAQPRFYKEERVSEVDDNFAKILHNYRQVMPVLHRSGVQLRTIGKSRLADAGVPQFLP